MSWKNVKEHYRIKHQVHVTNEGICIGSPYVHNLIVIGLDGVLKKRREGSGNADLTRYQAEMDADPAMLKQLVMAEDSFDGPGLPVFTYDGGRILEKRCDAYGWPNVTRDGCLMYENTFSSDKATVVGWAKRNASAVVAQLQRRVAEEEQTLQKVRDWLTKEEASLTKLNADYPEIPEAGKL